MIGIELARYLHKLMKGSDYITKDGKTYDSSEILENSENTGYRYHFRPPYSSESWIDF